MRSLAISFFLLASASVAFAQSQNLTFLAGFIAALNGAGLSTLANVTEQLNSTTTGQEIFALLSTGDSFLIFAPNNQAFSNAPSNITSDISVLAELLSYHVVSGNFSGISTTYPNVTLGRTFLNTSNLVKLEGGKSQVVAWAVGTDDHTHVLNQLNDSVVVSATSYQNIDINIVDSILSIPESFQQTVSEDNVSLTSLEDKLSLVPFNIVNPVLNETTTASLFEILNSSFHGYTFFAPQNSAMDAATSTISSLNSSAQQDLFLNHLINGMTVYSPNLLGQNYTSAGGQTLSVHINATGEYVTSGNVTALITQPDVLLTNGVLHVIDQVLLNTDVNDEAASSAIASATTAAEHSTTETLPIGFSQTASLAPPATQSSTSSPSSSAATKMSSPGDPLMIGLSVTIAGMLVGGLVALL